MLILHLQKRDISLKKYLAIIIEVIRINKTIVIAGYTLIEFTYLGSAEKLREEFNLNNPQCSLIAIRLKSAS